MRKAAILPAVLLAAGVGLVADAVARGGASVALVVVVPVVFGASSEFFLGVVLLFVGFLTLPLVFGYAAEPLDRGDAGGRPSTPSGEVAGFVLVGPVPIFFGRWRNVSTGVKVAAAVAGAAVLVALVYLFFRG